MSKNKKIIIILSSIATMLLIIICVLSIRGRVKAYYIDVKKLIIDEEVYTIKDKRRKVYLVNDDYDTFYSDVEIVAIPKFLSGYYLDQKIVFPSEENEYKYEKGMKKFWFKTDLDFEYTISAYFYNTMIDLTDPMMVMYGGYGFSTKMEISSVSSFRFIFNTPPYIEDCVEKRTFANFFDDSKDVLFTNTDYKFNKIEKININSNYYMMYVDYYGDNDTIKIYNLYFYFADRIEN